MGQDRDLYLRCQLLRLPCFGERKCICLQEKDTVVGHVGTANGKRTK